MVNFTFQNQKFPLGEVVMTQGAESLLEAEHQLFLLLQRHATGDWGDVCKNDARLNDQAVINGTRILSSYKIGNEVVWLITEADRAVTTFLTPDEY